MKYEISGDRNVVQKKKKKEKTNNVEMNIHGENKG